MTTSKKLLLNIALLGLGLTLNTSCTNDSPSEDSKEHAEEMNEETLNRDGEKDADRMVELHTANLFEIAASENAASKAVTAEVKKLAAMMVEAHTKMGADMQAMATKKGITLPTGMGNDFDREMEKLNEKTGIDFDKEYTDQMKNKHEDAVKTLERLSEKSEDAEVKQWASQSLPEIRSHLDMVETTRNTIKDMKSEARGNDKDHNDGKH